MAQRIKIPFVGATKRGRSVAVTDQDTLNLIQALKSPGAKEGYVLESAPGLVDLSVLGDGPIRSGKMINSSIRVGGTGKELYGVYGSQLMAQTASLGNVAIGTLNANVGRVRIARGRNYIAMVDGTDGYTYDGTTFAQITDLDFPGQAGAGAPTHMLYLDGFFMVNDALTDNFFISAKEDPTTWNALDFEAASVSPDNALAMEATESMLWIVGDETAQAYYNTGNADFPYSIILNATTEIGILAPQSIAESDSGIFYLATTPEGGRFVYQIKGQGGEIISGDEEEHLLNHVINPEDSYGFIYQQDGKGFYVLHTSAVSGPDPQPNMTMIYNIKARSWERRTLSDGSGWRIGGHGILDNVNVGGSRLQAKNLTLDLNNYQDAGQEMIRSRRTQIYHKDGFVMDWWSLIIDVETGVGTVTGQGSDPKLRMRYSDDAARTWSNWLTASLGRIGETLHQVHFDNLGQSRNRVFELKVSDPVPLTIIAAYAEVEVLAD